MRKLRMRNFVPRAEKLIIFHILSMIVDLHRYYYWFVPLDMVKFPIFRTYLRNRLRLIQVPIYQAFKYINDEARSQVFNGAMNIDEKFYREWRIGWKHPEAILDLDTLIKKVDTRWIIDYHVELRKRLNKLFIDNWQKIYEFDSYVREYWEQAGRNYLTA